MLITTLILSLLVVLVATDPDAIDDSSFRH